MCTTAATCSPGVVDHIVDRLYTDQLAARRQEDGWQDYLLRLAHGVRQNRAGKEGPRADRDSNELFAWLLGPPRL